jgi:hypothetical protein
MTPKSVSAVGSPNDTEAIDKIIPSNIAKAEQREMSLNRFAVSSTAFSCPTLRLLDGFSSGQPQ